MKTITIQERQTVWDIALQYCGDVEAVFQIIDINDISITEILSAGTTLTVPNAINKRVADYYNNNGISPATADMNNEEPKVLVDNTTLKPMVTNERRQYLIENSK